MRLRRQASTADMPAPGQCAGPEYGQLPAHVALMAHRRELLMRRRCNAFCKLSVWPGLIYKFGPESQSLSRNRIWGPVMIFLNKAGSPLSHTRKVQVLASAAFVVALSASSAMAQNCNVSNVSGTPAGLVGPGAALLGQIASSTSRLDRAAPLFRLRPIRRRIRMAAASGCVAPAARTPSRAPQPRRP